MLKSVASVNSNAVKIVIVDSGSYDGTPELLGKISNPSIQVICFDSNLGITENWKRAISSALIAIPSATHMMVLAGDDTLGSDFVGEIFGCMSRLDLGQQIFIPEFVKVKESPGIISTSNVLHSKNKPSIFQLSRHWEWAHVCYAVFPVSFVIKHYLPTLSSSSVAFDWWVTYAALDYEWVFCAGAKYFKFSKGKPYSSSYYQADTETSEDKKDASIVKSNVIELFFLPIIQVINLMKISSHSTESLSRVKICTLVISIFLGRVVDHFEKLIYKLTGRM